jgi:hypothetical protein
MKIKLLKKIRKRFGYYFRKSDGYPVLVDYKKRKHTIFSQKYLPELNGYSSGKEMMKHIEIDLEEYAWRCMKERMLKPFGFSYGDVVFNRLKRRCKKNKK